MDNDQTTPMTVEEIEIAEAKKKAEEAAGSPEVTTEEAPTEEVVA